VTSEDFVIVGIIGRTRGVHGDVYVTPATDFPERFESIDEIYIKTRTGWEIIKIVSASIVSGRPVLRFAGIDNREDAARLTNRALAVPRDQAVELPHDTFYIFDLIGCEVFDDRSGKLLGKVTDVEQYPANDIYVLDTIDGKKVLFPATRDFVKNIDIKNKKITVINADQFENE